MLGKHQPRRFDFFLFFALFFFQCDRSCCVNDFLYSYDFCNYVFITKICCVVLIQVKDLLPLPLIFVNNNIPYKHDLNDVNSVALTLIMPVSSLIMTVCYLHMKMPKCLIIPRFQSVYHCYVIKLTLSLFIVFDTMKTFSFIFSSVYVIHIIQMHCVTGYLTNKFTMMVKTLVMLYIIYNIYSLQQHMGILLYKTYAQNRDFTLSCVRYTRGMAIKLIVESLLIILSHKNHIICRTFICSDCAPCVDSCNINVQAIMNVALRIHVNDKTLNGLLDMVMFIYCIKNYTSRHYAYRLSFDIYRPCLHCLVFVFFKTMIITHMIIHCIVFHILMLTGNMLKNTLCTHISNVIQYIKYVLLDSKKYLISVKMIYETMLCKQFYCPYVMIFTMSENLTILLEHCVLRNACILITSYIDIYKYYVD